MYRLAPWLVVALTACRMNFDPLSEPDVALAESVDGGVATSATCPPGVTCIGAASGQDLFASCPTGRPCQVDCTAAASCVVDCASATTCEVTCAEAGCVVTGCLSPVCAVACWAMEPPIEQGATIACL